MNIRTHGRCWWAGIVLGSLWCAYGWAGTRDPHTPDARYLEFGQQFPSVVFFSAVGPCDNPNCPRQGDEHEQYGSAVIIRPHWVLTAAHLVKNTHSQKVRKDSGVEYPLQHVIVHREYDPDNIGWHDVALGYSAQDFALEFYTPLYTDTDELGKKITIAGYGVHGTFVTGGQHADGKKRAGHNVLESAERAVLVCTPSRGSNRLPLEFLIASGDSGGGMFIGNKLAGINSFLMATNQRPTGVYGNEAAFTRLSLYAAWVNEQMEQYELALVAQRTMAGDVQLVAEDTNP